MSTRTYEQRAGRHRRRQEPAPSQFDQLATGLADAVERLVRAFDPATTRPGLGDLFSNRVDADDRGTRRPRNCGCRACSGRCSDEPCRDAGCPSRCEPCDCHCMCCIGDVDVVVYARAAETRVIPIQLANNRKRERDITVRLSEFRTKGTGPTAVVGTLVGLTSFTLGPCTEREVVIVVRAGLQGRDAESASADPSDLGDLSKSELLDEAQRVGVRTTAAMTKNDLISAINSASSLDADFGRKSPIGTPQIDRTLPDVDDCHVAVADLCIEGCDSRPIRIAVVILPRDCNSYDVQCDCACC